MDSLTISLIVALAVAIGYNVYWIRKTFKYQMDAASKGIRLVGVLNASINGYQWHDKGVPDVAHGERVRVLIDDGTQHCYPALYAHDEGFSHEDGRIIPRASVKAWAARTTQGDAA